MTDTIKIEINEKQASLLINRLASFLMMTDELCASINAQISRQMPQQAPEQGRPPAEPQRRSGNNYDARP